MDKRKKRLENVNERWRQEADRLSEEDKGSYMPREIELTESEYDAHFLAMRDKQRVKAKKGMPLFVGSKVKRVKRYYV